MALRTSHGTGAKSALVRVEASPPDELPRGVPAPAPPDTSKQRQAFGPVPACTPEARALASHAARARWAQRDRVKALQGLGLHETPEWLAPYEAAATEFCQVVQRSLAEAVGGGHCPSFAGILIQNAALALAASRAQFARGEALAGARLADSVRTQVLTAWELTARAAGERPAPVAPELAEWFPELASAPAKKGRRK